MSYGPHQPGAAEPPADVPPGPGVGGYGYGQAPGGAQGYAGPYGYPGPYPYPYPPMRPRTNTLAILALVFGFVCAPAAIVLGAVARRQIRRTGEEGMGLATAGLVLGIVFTVLGILWIALIVTVFAHAVHDINQQQTASSLLIQAHGSLRR
jgi:hypothetical protein